MIGKTTAFIGLTLLIVVLGVLSTSTVFAGEPTTVKILAKNGGGQFKIPVGEATLTLTLKNGEIKIVAQTGDLAPEHVFSVWGIINDEPAFNLTGFISDGDGNADFSGTAHLGNLELKTFVIKIKDHGAPVKGKIQRQKKTKNVNCEPIDCPTVQEATFNIS